MNTPPNKHLVNHARLSVERSLSFRKRLLQIVAIKALLGAAVAFPVSALALDWQGLHGDGGDGVWQSSNFTGSGTDFLFPVTPTLTETHALVTLNTAASGKNMNVSGGKEVTLQFESGGSLTLSAILSVGNGEVSSTASTNTLTMLGPATGRAQVKMGRFYTDSPANTDTIHRNSFIVNGNIDVELSGSFTQANRNSTIVFDGGAKVISTGTAANMGTIYSRSGNAGAIYDNRVSFLKADVEGIGFYAHGLMQFGRESTLKTSAISKGIAGNPAAATIYVGDELTKGNRGTLRGRLEVEGDGFAADIITNVYGGATFAIGLSDPDTMTRTEAADFTLNSVVNFTATNAVLEMGIFGDESDSLIFNTGGLTGNFILRLKVHGSEPLLAGQTYTLFDIAPDSTVADGFQVNLSQLDPAIWDVSNFNQAGGWQVTVIPEPNAVFLGMAGLALCGAALRKRRKDDSGTGLTDG